MPAEARSARLFRRKWPRSLPPFHLQALRVNPRFISLSIPFRAALHALYCNRFGDERNLTLKPGVDGAARTTAWAAGPLSGVTIYEGHSHSFVGSGGGRVIARAERCCTRH